MKRNERIPWNEFATILLAKTCNIALLLRCCSMKCRMSYACIFEQTCLGVICLETKVGLVDLSGYHDAYIRAPTANFAASLDPYFSSKKSKKVCLTVR